MCPCIILTHISMALLKFFQPMYEENLIAKFSDRVVVIGVNLPTGMTL